MQKFSDGASGQLCLFGPGGVDLVKLRALRGGLEAPRRAASTLAAYECDWRDFRGWCAAAGLESLPALPGTVDLYVTSVLLEGGKRVSTAARRVAAILHFHRQAALAVPDTSGARLAIAAVKRDRREQPKGKAPLYPDSLLALSGGFDARTLAGSRDRALVLLGFATTLRRSELGRLQLSDVAFRPEGVAVFVRFSKNDQEGRGRLIGVWPGLHRLTDPVAALRRWLAVRGDWAGPLFCRIRADGRIVRNALRGEAVCQIVKRAVDGLGLDPAGYGAHSLRRGSITTAAALGRSNQEIMGLSGHASEAVMRMYVDRARVFAGNNPLAGAL